MHTDSCMKLRLNVDELNDDFFEDTRLLGITAPVKNYQFCLYLNNQLGYDFRRKGPAGRRHFGTSWRIRIDRLIVRQRPKRSNITVTDRKSVVVQIIEHIAW